MSASSARRLKDRNGVAAATATQKPTKALTPISISDKAPNSTTKRSLSGKENPTRPNTRAQKPAIRQVPRVDKAAVGDGSEGRMRDSRVSKGESDNRVVSRAEKGGIRGLKENGFIGESKKRNGLCEGNDLKILESKKQLRGLKVLNGNFNKEVNLRKSREFDSNLDSKVASGGKFDKGLKKQWETVAGSSSSKSGGNDTGTIVVVEKNEIEIAPIASCQSHYVSNANDYGCELKGEEKLPIPVEEKPIALEFLDSHSKEDDKETVRDVKVGLASLEVQEMGDGSASGKQDSSYMFNTKCEEDLLLATDETLDEFVDQENRNTFLISEENDDTCVYQVNEIGTKSSTGGWFVSEGESILTHDDGSCSFYDIANCEEKAVYKPPAGVSPNIWRDCWIIHAPGADGCSGRYVVAASAGTTLDSGFCSWDFYAKDVRAFHFEDGGTTASRKVLGSLPNNTASRRNALSGILLPETQQWWYKPCGPLMVSTASSQKVVKIHDIRDGEQIMKWEVQKPVLAMDYSSPLQWRNKGKLVVAEAETISVWDVNSLNPQPLLSVSLAGRKISALHVINTDAELGGGVRQRATSAEAEENDGVFCTPDSINVLDFRNPSGIGLKIPKIGVSVQSVFTRGDSIYIGCANTRFAGKKHPCPQVQHFSLRKQRLVNTYSLPESNSHSHHSAITQVWGNSNLVMGVCGLGLFAFDASKDDSPQSFTGDISSTQKVKDVIGSDDLYSPSFDYLASCALLISRDRPALWKQLL
ncbi:hypothetical protein OIU78_004375 [Salix suchowensis]|nr:hypothetical protein OIU78_004375 [Salix suchowensis]